LQTIRRSQGIFIQQLQREFSKLIAGKYFPPSTAQQLQARGRSFPAGVRDLRLPMEAANSAVNLHYASPPDDRRKFSQVRLSRAACCFVNTQRNECAGIPERGYSFHGSSLSSTTA
jgi:hypothetical protein